MTAVLDITNHFLFIELHCIIEETKVFILHHLGEISSLQSTFIDHRWFVCVCVLLMDVYNVCVYFGNLDIMQVVCCECSCLCEFTLMNFTC